MADRVPLVSIVMGAYNAAQDIESSVESLLRQEGVDFELIVVNDGSQDDTVERLTGIARRDPRVRLIDKPRNEGLTRALIDGCDAARGEFIARQDSDDCSLPGRLAAQVAALRARPDAVLVSCGTRFIGPRGENLFEVARDGMELQRGLEQTDLARIEGPSCHGSVMFRRDAYIAAGGYRPEFLIAQDLDLWVRLSEMGLCLGMPEVLYEAAWRPGSISDLYRALQVRARETVLESRVRRRAGGDDAAMIEGFQLAVEAAWRNGRRRPPNGRSRARFAYFVGSNLARRDDAAAQEYFREAVQAWPWDWKAWAKWGMTSIRVWREGD